MVGKVALDKRAELGHLLLQVDRLDDLDRDAAQPRDGAGARDRGGVALLDVGERPRKVGADALARVQAGGGEVGDHLRLRLVLVVELLPPPALAALGRRRSVVAPAGSAGDRHRLRASAAVAARPPAPRPIARIAHTIARATVEAIAAGVWTLPGRCRAIVRWLALVVHRHHLRATQQERAGTRERATPHPTPPASANACPRGAYCVPCMLGVGWRRRIPVTRP